MYVVLLSIFCQLAWFIDATNLFGIQSNEVFQTSLNSFLGDRNLKNLTQTRHPALFNEHPSLISNLLDLLTNDPDSDDRFNTFEVSILLVFYSMIFKVFK